MDPNAALARIRHLADRILDERTSEDVAGFLASELADTVTGLDEWLTRGGFLPEPWAQRSVVETGQRPWDPAPTPQGSPSEPGAQGDTHTTPEDGYMATATWGVYSPEVLVDSGYPTRQAAERALAKYTADPDTYRPQAWYVAPAE